MQKAFPEEKTDVSAKIYLQMSWYMEILTSFVSDNNIKSMLNSNLDRLVEYSKNPQIAERVVEEKEEICIFNLCF